MSETNTSIAELEDKKGVVYAIGISRDVSEEVVEWVYSEDFNSHWNAKFQYAEYIIIPMMFEGVVQVEAKSVDQFKEMLREEVGEE